MGQQSWLEIELTQQKSTFATNNAVKDTGTHLTKVAFMDVARNFSRDGQATSWGSVGAVIPQVGFRGEAPESLQNSTYSFMILEIQITHR